MFPLGKGSHGSSLRHVPSLLQGWAGLCCLAEYKPWLLLKENIGDLHQPEDVMRDGHGVCGEFREKLMERSHCSGVCLHEHHE